MEIQQPSSVGQATALFTGLTQAQVQDTIKRIYPYRAINTNIHSKNAQQAISSTGSYTDYKEKDFIEAHRLLQGVITNPWQCIHDIESGKADPFYYDSGASDIKDIQQHTIGRVTGASEARDPRTGFVDNLLKLKTFQKQMDNDYSYGYLTNLFQTQVDNGSTYYQTQAQRQNAEIVQHTNNQLAQRAPIDHHVFLKGLPMGHMNAPHDQRKRKLAYNPHPLFTNNTRRTKLDNLHARFTKHIDDGDHQHEYTTYSTPIEPPIAHPPMPVPHSDVSSIATRSHRGSLPVSAPRSGAGSLPGTIPGSVHSTSFPSPVASGFHTPLHSTTTTSVVRMVPTGISSQAISPLEPQTPPQQNVRNFVERVIENLTPDAGPPQYEEQATPYETILPTPYESPLLLPRDSTMFQSPAPQNFDRISPPNSQRKGVERLLYTKPLSLSQSRFVEDRRTKDQPNGSRPDPSIFEKLVNDYKDTLAEGEYPDLQKYKTDLNVDIVTLEDLIDSVSKGNLDISKIANARADATKQWHHWTTLFDEAHQLGFDVDYIHENLPHTFTKVFDRNAAIRNTPRKGEPADTDTTLFMPLGRSSPPKTQQQKLVEFKQNRAAKKAAELAAEGNAFSTRRSGRQR